MAIFVRDKGFYKKLALLAIPVILQNIISIGVNIMDTVMLGSFGEAQLSASSLAGQYANIFQVLCFGIGGGASVMTAQYWGKGDLKSLKQTITVMVRICVGIGLLFNLLAVLFPAGIMRVYTPDANIIREGVRYFTFLSWTFVFNGLSVTLSIVLRSMRLVRIPLLATIGSFFVNIFFNWVFIFGRLGAPRLEIQGAAIGTLLARIFEVIIIGGYFLSKNAKVSYRLPDLFSSCRAVLNPFIRFSIPVIISDLLLTLGDSVLSMIMGRIGPEFVSANAITMVVVRLASVFSMGLSGASAVMTGNTLGEGDKERAYREGVSFFAISILVGLLGGGMILLLSPTIINYYNVTDATKEIARQLMLSISIMFAFRSLSSATTKGVLRGGGDTRFLMVADILFLWIVSIPAGYLFALVWQLPPFWIYVAFRLEFVLKAIWTLHRFRTRKWMVTV